MKGIFFFCVMAVTLAAQDQTASGTGGGYTRGVTAASQFFEHDFVNLYVFANGVWDSRLPELSGSTSTTGIGWEVGGGVTASHEFKGGDFTINYMGAYRDYQSGLYSGGTQQSLALGYRKMLNRHWSFGANVSGGVLSYGSGYYSGSSVSSGNAANPFSSQSRFLDAGLNLTYSQTRRLSYVFSGSFFLSNYNYANAFSSYGGTGGVSVLYRTTARTTVGANYAHTYYTYSHGAGTSQIDGLNLSLSHQFTGHWQLDLSGGINRARTKGIISIPVSQILDTGQQVIVGYYVGPYNRTVNSPAYQAALTHYLRHQSFSVSGGQSILGGNGTYLTSTNRFANASYSYSTRHTNLGFAGYYSRLTSVANNVNQSFGYSGFGASYGINLVRYVSANFRYDFLHYDGLFSYSGLNEHRISFGLSMSTKSVPLTLF